MPLSHGKVCLVDRADYEHLNAFRWFAKKSAGCWYAVRKVVSNGHEYLVRMHRQITNCPHGQVVHHRNHNSLDNRRQNLLPCTDDFHKFLHYWDYTTATEA